MRLDHFLWYPVKGEGYPKIPLACSGEFNLHIYMRIFENQFIPIIVDSYSENFRGYLLFNNPVIGDVIFTSIFPKEEVDEYGRAGIFHHSVIIPRDDLKEGRISLFSIEESMRAYEEENPFPEGKIEKLEVPDNEMPSFAYIDNLKKIATERAVESVATHMMKSKENRAIFRCKDASQLDRFRIGVYLVELLNFVCDIREISFSTDPPLSDSQYPLFDMLVLKRVYSPQQDADNWGVVFWDMLERPPERIKHKEEIYRKIEEAFQ